MAKQTTKKQHYIWRGYLKRWTNDNSKTGRVHTFRKEPQGKQPEFENAKLENVGFGKFYYDMSGFSKYDVAIASQLISRIQKDKPFKLELNADLFEDANTRRDFIEGQLCGYEDIDNKYELIERIINGDLSFYRDSPLQIARDIAMIEMYNALYGRRIFSDAELQEIADEAKKQADEVDLKHEFLRFFFMMHQRSPHVHDMQDYYFEEVKKAFPKIKDAKTYFYVNSLMIFSTEQIALNMCTNMHSWLERYENKTDLPFITSDCPVVNLTGSKINEKHEFYFPLSPTVAIKLCSSFKGSKNGTVENQHIVISDEEIVEQLNYRTASEACKEVYSNNESVLRRMAERLKSDN